MPVRDGIIYVDSSVTPPIGVSVADVQSALGTSKYFVNELCTFNNINPMAKYKPVRYNKLAALTDNEFKSINYGLSEGALFNASDATPNNTWTYNRPRGKRTNSSPQDQYTDEPYRLSDFNKYDRLACPPFAFEVSGELDSSVGLTFFIDSMSKEVYHGMRWSEETCFRLSELVAVQGRYLCVAIHDLDKAGSCVVILNKEVSTIGQYGSTIILYAETTTISGITYPGVSLLSERDRNGHRFRFIVGMRNNNDGQTLSQAYKVLGTNEVSGLYSLALTSEADRKDVVLGLLDTIGNLKFSLSSTNLTFSYQGTVVRNGGQQWNKYLLTGSVYGTFVTPTGQWAVDSVSVDIYLRSDAGYVNPDDNGISIVGKNNVWSKGNIDISQNNHTYNNVEVGNIYQVPVYIYKDAPASVQVSARVRYVSEKMDAENKIIVSQ